MLLASTGLPVETSISLCCRDEHIIKNHTTMATETDASPSERLASISADMATCVDGSVIAEPLGHCAGRRVVQSTKPGNGKKFSMYASRPELFFYFPKKPKKAKTANYGQNHKKNANFEAPERDQATGKKNFFFSGYKFI